jgi:N-acyl-L-homoserine lactone synthetase
MEVAIHEDLLLVKDLDTVEEIRASQRLRHDVFARELQWVPQSPDGLEVDVYDAFSEYMGVFDEIHRIVGLARLIISPNPFMVDKEFACLMPGGRAAIKGADMAEITRLCVKKEDRPGSMGGNVSALLYKGIYQWSLSKGIRHLVMVVDKRYFRLLRLCGFPVKALGEFITMPDGVKAGACSLDWREFEEITSWKKPEFLRWMKSLPARYPSQSQPHEPYLQH